MASKTESFSIEVTLINAPGGQLHPCVLVKLSEFNWQRNIADETLTMLIRYGPIPMSYQCLRQYDKCYISNFLIPRPRKDPFDTRFSVTVLITSVLVLTRSGIRPRRWSRPGRSRGHMADDMCTVLRERR